MRSIFDGRRVRHRFARQRSGYVLIMTLVVIAIAALCLAGFARKSLLLASESIEAQRELQRYWGAHSCRTLLLDEAEALFFSLEESWINSELPWPAPASFSTEFELSGMRYRLWLSDEDAKLNLNALTGAFPEHRRNILGQLTDNSIPLVLQPESSAESQTEEVFFSSWGHVIDFKQFGETFDNDALIELTNNITCWGSGKLNIKRIPDRTLLLIAGRAVNQRVAQKLLAGRKESTDLEWVTLLKSCALTQKDEAALKKWFSDKSRCYCLWLELDDGQRRSYQQWILGDPLSETSDSLISFRW